jgi:hypothetical protein
MKYYAKSKYRKKYYNRYYKYSKYYVNEAIKELYEAKRYLRQGKLERAEDELADTLTDIAKALRYVNKQEYRRKYN